MRMYDYQWRKLSERIRKERPLCEICYEKGKVTPSEHVHHIVEISADPSRRLDVTNLQAICVPCHNFLHSGPTKGSH